MKKILVGVDGSETAERAAREAAQLAVLLDGELHLVTAAKRGGSKVVRSGGETWQINDLDRAESMLHALAGTLKPATVVCAVLDGEPAKAIVTEAERIAADMIVVGNKRTHGAARVLGAVALDVVRHAPCAVYIAKTS